MTERTKNESTLTVDQVSEIVGDDIAFWLGNPFMTPEMLVAKVCWWVTRARSNPPEPCVAPPGNLCTETGCWDADRCVVFPPAQPGADR